MHGFKCSVQINLRIHEMIFSFCLLRFHFCFLLSFAFPVFVSVWEANSSENFNKTLTIFFVHHFAQFFWIFHLFSDGRNENYQCLLDFLSLVQWDVCTNFRSFFFNKKKYHFWFCTLNHISFFFTWRKIIQIMFIAGVLLARIKNQNIPSILFLDSKQKKSWNISRFFPLFNTRVVYALSFNNISLTQELDQLTMLIVGLLSTTIHKTPEATDI